MNQRIITSADNFIGLSDWIDENKCSTLMVVCGRFNEFRVFLNKYLISKLDKRIKIVYFHDYQPNPLYENVQKGVSLFRDNKCDSLIAVGGGSAIDVAKCIKMYSAFPGTGNNGEWLRQEHVIKDIPFLVIPTTAGSGSEATRYAVIYFNGEKQSITSECFIPETVMMVPNLLKSLPEYQKKATMMDALSHAIESFWSVNSTDESKEYSRIAIQGILKNIDGYMNNTEESRLGMLMAANMAGKAINITQTTAGHAMCYKITTMFGCAHGHAAIMCNRVLYGWMINNTDKCIDSRGEKYLKQVLDEIAYAMGCADAQEGAEKVKEVFKQLKLDIPQVSKSQYDELISAVNLTRLKNFPISLDENIMEVLYQEVFK